MNYFRKIFSGLFCFLLFSSAVFAANQEYDVTQGEFAIQLVNILNLQSYLPPAPDVEDYISVLELFGIVPLKGWHSRQVLLEEDYIVIVSKLSGQEREVYRTGVEFCNKVTSTINEAWEDQKKTDGEYESLDKLFQDPRYFAGEIPACPFGHSYQVKKGTHQVKRHHHLQKFLTSLRFGF